MYRRRYLELDIHRHKNAQPAKGLWGRKNPGGGGWSLPWEHLLWGQIMQWPRAKEKDVVWQTRHKTVRPEQRVFLLWFLLKFVVLLAVVHMFFYILLSLLIRISVLFFSSFDTVKLLSIIVFISMVTRKISHWSSDVQKQEHLCLGSDKATQVIFCSRPGGQR